MVPKFLHRYALKQSSGFWFRSFCSSVNPPSSTSPTGNNSSPRPVFNRLPHLSYEDFLHADRNRDGKLTAAEWEAYVNSKLQAANAQDRNETGTHHRGCTIHLPISPETFRSFLESEGLGITLNGHHYSLHLRPEGDTIQLIESQKEALMQVTKEIQQLEEIKAPLDARAAAHTKWVLRGLVLYLVGQAGVVAKLTFFSRFGWDVMERRLFAS